MTAPLGWMFKYFIGSIVGAATVVQGIRILKIELGNNVEGVIFRLGLGSDRDKGSDG